MLGIMLDVSRNMVMKVDHLKLWFRRLSLSGYNLVMLYTEDTYQLPGEPFFGYMRGAYSIDEIKELDAYAKKLGIELVGCIQTLGHLEQIIRWHGAYGKISDTAKVLMVDEPKTYELIDKMIATAAGFTSAWTKLTPSAAASSSITTALKRRSSCSTAISAKSTKSAKSMAWHR